MQTFVVIMGAGRCGSTSTISFLNKYDNFNIYGENNGVICSLLENITKLQGLNLYKGLSHRQPNSGYKISKYIGSEWYNPQDKIDTLKQNLTNEVINYFDQSVDYVGFKEIRWDKNNITALTLLHKYYNVKYVHLIRNIKDQVDSIKKIKWNIENPTTNINSINETISNFLKKQNSKNYIVKNISTDKNFKEEIYHFLTEQNKNCSRGRIDNADE